MKFNKDVCKVLVLGWHNQRCQSSVGSEWLGSTLLKGVWVPGGQQADQVSVQRQIKPWAASTGCYCGADRVWSRTEHNSSGHAWMNMNYWEQHLMGAIYQHLLCETHNLLLSLGSTVQQVFHTSWDMISSTSQHSLHLICIPLLCLYNVLKSNSWLKEVANRYNPETIQNTVFFSKTSKMRKKFP